jgi:hypothetical protein
MLTMNFVEIEQGVARQVIRQKFKDVLAILNLQSVDNVGYVAGMEVLEDVQHEIVGTGPNKILDIRHQLIIDFDELA